MWLFQTGPDRYRSAKPSQDGFGEIDQKKIVRIVGYVALGLPIVLWLASNNPIYATCYRNSISHYYYAPFWGTAFTGALFFIGTYLIVWKGEEEKRRDGKLASWAGAAAFGVALFPTSHWGCEDPEFSARPITDFILPEGVQIPQLMPNDTPPEEYSKEVVEAFFRLDFPISWLSWLQAEWLHYLSALFMFGFLAWFAFAVFTRVESNQKKGDGLTTEKYTRNTLYYLSGTIITLCILALLASFIARNLLDMPLAWWDEGNWTFIFEAIALLAFGFSWMVKGQVFKFLNDKS